MDCTVHADFHLEGLAVGIEQYRNMPSCHEPLLIVVVLEPETSLPIFLHLPLQFIPALPDEFDVAEQIRKRQGIDAGMVHEPDLAP